MRLKEKVALVTGAGAGMGAAVARGFVREGARVVLADANEAAARAVAESLGPSARAVRCDVSRAADCAVLAQTAHETFGGLDILYNNAAIQLHGQDVRAHELTEEVWDRTMAVNLKGVWLVSKYALPLLLARGGGSVIHVGSPTGLFAAPPYTAYATSKGGVAALTRTMAAEYAADHIRVNCLIPGPIETGLTASVFTPGPFRESIESATLLKRIGTPEDVVGLALFLASDESSYCTGGLFMADGGITAA